MIDTNLAKCALGKVMLWIVVVWLICGQAVHATHLRMGSMAWSSTGKNKQKLVLNFRMAMRRSASWIRNSRVGDRYCPVLRQPRTRQLVHHKNGIHLRVV